jgi:hypothetical protein
MYGVQLERPARKVGKQRSTSSESIGPSGASDSGRMLHSVRQLTRGQQLEYPRSVNSAHQIGKVQPVYRSKDARRDAPPSESVEEMCEK